MDREKNHIPLANKNQSYEKKNTDTWKDKKPDISQEDSDLQRNRVVGQSDDKAAFIPSKQSHRLPATKSNDFLWIDSNQKQVMWMIRWVTEGILILMFQQSCIIMFRV